MTNEELNASWTLPRLIAYIEIWAQPPHGWPSHDHRMPYELDMKKGWYYLTVEGEKMKREHQEEVARWETYYRGEVDKWAKKTVALLDDIWDEKTQNDSGIIDAWGMEKA